MPGFLQRSHGGRHGCADVTWADVWEEGEAGGGVILYVIMSWVILIMLTFVKGDGSPHLGRQDEVQDGGEQGG